MKKRSISRHVPINHRNIQAVQVWNMGHKVITQKKRKVSKFKCRRKVEVDAS